MEAELTFPDAALAQPQEEEQWSVIHRVTFRFLFIFLLLSSVLVHTILSSTPLLRVLYYAPAYWIERYLLGMHYVGYHLPTGSGDTLDDWMLLTAWIALALFGTIVWSVVDRNRRQYGFADRFLRGVVRISLAAILVSYGLLKVFCLQMPRPTLAQLYAPLGSLSPMRLAWLYVGYSAPYEIFTGALELLAGLLLFSRRTALFGSLLASAVMANVVAINFCYDIPVKLFSSLYLFNALFLSAPDLVRIVKGVFMRRAIVLPPFPSVPRKLQAVWVVACLWILVVNGIWPAVSSSTYVSAQRLRHPKYYGAYVVTNTPATTGRAEDWTQIVIGEGGPSVGYRGFVRRGIFIQPANFILPTDTTLSVSFHRYEEPTRFTIHSDGLANLTLIPDSGQQIVHELRLQKEEKPLPLMEKPFHWVSATPY